MRRLVPLVLLLLVACGGQDQSLPAIGDDSSCDEVVAVVEEAVDRARLFIGTENTDAALGDELVFALSAVDARPECVPQQIADQARGLRQTIATGT